MTFQVFYGLDHLKKIETCTEIAFDCETTQLQPVRGGLRLMQFGCMARETIVLIDAWDLLERGWEEIQRFATNGDRYWLAHNAQFDLA